MRQTVFAGPALAAGRASPSGASSILKSQLSCSYACILLQVGLQNINGIKARSETRPAPRGAGNASAPPGHTHGKQPGPGPATTMDLLGSWAVLRPLVTPRGTHYEQLCQPVKAQCIYLPFTSPCREWGELLLRQQYSYFKFHLKTIQFGEILCNTSLSFEKHCAAENTQTIGRRL